MPAIEAIGLMIDRHRRQHVPARGRAARPPRPGQARLPEAHVKKEKGVLAKVVYVSGKWNVIALLVMEQAC